MAIVCHGSPATARGFRLSGGDSVAADFAVAELAWHYGVAEGTVGRWLSEDRIPGRRDPLNRRRKLYPLDAVQRSYEKRHATQAAA